MEKEKTCGCYGGTVLFQEKGGAGERTNRSLHTFGIIIFLCELNEKG